MSIINDVFKPKLSLNKHPKTCENLSLTYANNVRLSNDAAVLQSDNSIIFNDEIKNKLENYYTNGYEIIGNIACNIELVIFVFNKNNNKISKDNNTSLGDIWVYDEPNNVMSLRYVNFVWYGGEIHGTFTYNIENDLIISFTEVGTTILDVPLRTLKLSVSTTYDKQILPKKLPINPEITIPSVIDYEFIKEQSYKGEYYFFLRYKINETDYTQCYNISNKILICDIERQAIIKYYGYSTEGENNYVPFSTGALDNFSNDQDVTQQTVELKINNIDVDYSHYQIGFICVRNDYTKCYISQDIIQNGKEFSYIIQTDLMSEHDPIDLITTRYNPVNVKNILNYQNRLYIANFEENNVEDNIAYVDLILQKENKSYYDLKSIIYEKLNENDKDIYVSYETDYAEKQDVEILPDDDIEPIIQKDLIVGDKKYNTFVETIDLLSDKLNYLVVDNDYINAFKNFLTSSEKEYKLVKNLYILSTNKILLTLTIEINHKKVIKEQANSYVGETYLFIDGKIFIGEIVDELEVAETLAFGLYGFKIKTFNITKEVLLSALETYNFDYQDTIKNGLYVNTKLSLNDRKKQTTLIPNEIYNFYIHYVDKYGTISKGYKINSRYKYYNAEDYSKNQISEERVLINIGENLCRELHLSYPYYVEVLADAVVDINQTVPMSNTLIKSIEYKGDNIYIGNTTESYNIDEDDNYEKRLISDYIYHKYSFIKYSNKKFKYRDLPDVGIINAFSNVINSKGEMFYKIPADDIKYYKDSINDAWYDNYEYPIYSFIATNVEIPQNYIGYFYSYERVEYRNKATGILTKYDIGDSESGNLIKYNDLSSQDVKFYCSEIDIDETFISKFNVLKLESKITLDNSSDSLLDGAVFDNMINLNTVQKSYETLNIYINLKDTNIKLGGDIKKDRNGLGSCISINISDVKILNKNGQEISLGDYLFKDNKENIYKASLLYLDSDYYLNDVKSLVKCSNIKYGDEKLKLDLDGYCTYNDFLVYNHNKVIYNQITGEIYDQSYNSYYDFSKSLTDIIPEDAKIKFLKYCQIPVYKNYLMETKEYNNEPKAINIYLKPIDKISEGESENTLTELSNSLIKGLFVEPEHSIDLFKNKYINPDNINPYLFVNYREDDINKFMFNKTIRRSNVIQDESTSNNWRNFGVENYKIIQENKGQITNLIKQGDYLLVHTEHSAFIFNSDNTIKAENQNILLANSDIFDLHYKELIASDLGYGGLQNRKEAINTDFGYIYYDNDSRKIFKFGNGAIETISDDIVLFLNKYKPHTLRFANDKYNNRLLVLLKFTDNTKENVKVLSYNYLINNFISFHDFTFDDSVSTKNNLYLIKDNKFYNFDKTELNNNNYGLIENTNNVNNCQLDIIVNQSYDTIKVLNNIVYKLYKYKINKNTDYENSPVEEQHLPYSGERIRIYNNEVDTGWIDIKIDTNNDKNKFMNYTKPYWHLGNWNFNYLRNQISKQLGNDFMSKLYGNYFIISIIFGDSNEKVEFESLGYNINTI